MADASNNYVQWLESEAARLVAMERTDTETIRALLVLSCHSSPLARRFFADRLDSEALLSVSEGLVAPVIGEPLKRHCWLNGSTPETSAVKVALEPLRICCATGLTPTMAGATEMRTGALVHDWNSVVT